MASVDIVNLIIELTADMLVYLLPVIALLSGLMFLMSLLIHVTIGSVKRW